MYLSKVPDEYLAHYPEDLDEDRRLLLGMVTALDEAVGRVVQALKDTGRYDNTVIVFSSDNGGVGMNGGTRKFCEFKVEVNDDEWTSETDGNTCSIESRLH